MQRYMLYFRCMLYFSNNFNFDHMYDWLAWNFQNFKEKLLSLKLIFLPSGLFFFLLILKVLTYSLPLCFHFLRYVSVWNVAWFSIYMEWIFSVKKTDYVPLCTLLFIKIFFLPIWLWLSLKKQNKQKPFFPKELENSL